MTDAELLTECKKGLGITSTTHDGVLAQKIQIVKAFMSGAGVSDIAMAKYTAIGAIICGVTDLWNVSGGDIKFSPLFYDLVNQARGR